VTGNEGEPIVFRRRATPRSGVVLALCFAVVCLFAQSFRLWFPSLMVKGSQPLPVTVRLPSPYTPISILRNRGVYESYPSARENRCPQVFERGSTTVDPACQRFLAQIQDSAGEISYQRLVGFFLFYLSAGLLLAYWMRHEFGRSRRLRIQVVVFFLLVFMVASVKAVLLLTNTPALAAPAALVTLLMARHAGRGAALNAGVCAALLAASLVDFDLEVLLSLTAGVLAVCALKSGRGIRAAMRSSILVAAAMMCTSLILRPALSGWSQRWPLEDFFRPSMEAAWLMVLTNGLLSGFGDWLLGPIMGLLVGSISRSRLFKLQDIDHPLLKLQQERTPGTWAHARQTADLAETATNAIGANAALARVGAYFHDVGKTAHPEFFIENHFGAPNPHDGMTPEQSAAAIIDHVVEGVHLLRKRGIPEDVVEFAYSHHGTSVAEYFWHKQVSSGNASGLPETAFCYPGQQPQTRETAIMMLADSVEAAARTVVPPEEIGFRAMVGQIFGSKLRQGQLDESGLSVAELRLAANTMVRFLVNLHHARISYPHQVSNKNPQAAKPAPVKGKRSQG
jgi:putative nucleotidyltransferase with HDIG domain